jgi:hypothetical protein
MVMTRGGTNDLRIETGRYEKLEEEERICIFCGSGEVEDERHFLCRCEAWKDERVVVLREVGKPGVRMTEEEIMFVSGKQEVKGKGQARAKGWRKIVLRGVMLMERERKKEWKRVVMGVGQSSSGSSSSSSSSSVSSSVSRSVDMLVYAVELLSVGL